MQLLHDHQTLLATVRDLNMMTSTMASKDVTSESFECPKGYTPTLVRAQSSSGNGPVMSVGCIQSGGQRLSPIGYPKTVLGVEVDPESVGETIRMLTKMIGKRSGTIKRSGKPRGRPLPISGIKQVKEKRSSDGSLLLMNPVASGDNVTTGMNSTHKLKEEMPPLVPCCEGKELQINEELVRTGLSAISVKHDNSVIQCVSMSRACERMMVPPGLVKHRNSFRSLHRPDLKRVPYLRRMSPDQLETLFRGYADFPGSPKSDNREEARMSLPPDDNHRNRDTKKETIGPDDGNSVNPLHPIPETRSGAEDVPAGMRLHGARARLYTSVLAGAKAGDQLDGNQTSEEYDHRVSDDPLPEEEVQLNEELQIILPPRCDDVTPESSTTTATTEDSTS